MDAKIVRALFELVTARSRIKRLVVTNAFQRFLHEYVRACGGWKRAFPSSLNGDVFVGTRFDISEMADYWIEENFRLPRDHIDYIRQKLGIPDIVRTKNRDRCNGFVAFCMVLYKLSAPRRMCDFRDLFGGTKQRCGRVVNHVIIFLYKRFRAKLNTLDRERLTDDYLLRLCALHHRKNQVMDNIWGFIDATIRPCCKPVRYQDVIYNGKDKVHAIKFQTVVTWDGMISHCNGPWAGARHDTGIYAESKLEDFLHDMPHVPSHGNPPLALYSDIGYAFSARLCVPFPDGRVNARHAAFNHSMSQSRITVEWAYGRVLQLWSSLDFNRNLKLFKSPIGALYMVAVLLTNVVTCTDRSNEISMYSGCRVPTLDEYLQTLACNT